MLYVHISKLSSFSISITLQAQMQHRSSNFTLQTWKWFPTLGRINTVSTASLTIALPRNTRYYQEHDDPGSEDALSPSSGRSCWKTAHWWGQKPGRAETVHPTREKTVEVSAHGSSFTSPEEHSHHFFTGLHQHLLPCRVNNVELLKGKSKLLSRGRGSSYLLSKLFDFAMNWIQMTKQVRNGSEGFQLAPPTCSDLAI